MMNELIKLCKLHICASVLCLLTFSPQVVQV